MVSYLVVGRGEITDQVLAMIEEAEGGEARVDLFTDSGPALKAAAVKGYNICLVEYSLGRADGFSFLKQIEELYIPLPVVFFIGRSDESKELDVKAAGGAYLFNVDMADAPLLRRLAALIRTYQRTQVFQTRRLKQLSTKLIDSLEEERDRLARELHDSVSQSLVGIKMGLENLQDLLNKGRAKPQLLDGLISMTEFTMTEIESITNNLRPPMLGDLGLISSLKWLKAQVEDSHPEVEIFLSITAVEDGLPEHLKLTIFRVAQEALSNAVRHGRAEHISLSLISNGGLELSISDDGIGFDPAEQPGDPDGWTSMGLVNMRERVVLSRGRFSVESARGEGALIVAVWSD